MVDRAKRPKYLSPVSRSPQPIVHMSPDNNTVLARLPTGETAEVLLFGATVTSWKNPDGSENLWMSQAAVLDGSKPARGGVPIVFPVFGPPPNHDHPTSSLPPHGFARNVRWEYLGKGTTEEVEGKGAQDSSVQMDFGLYSSALPDNFRKAWPYEFGLVYTVTLSPEGLRTFLSVRNTGKESFGFQVLFHTYFKIKDIGTTKVTGLTGVSYLDKVQNSTMQTQSEAQVSIAGEVDRVYYAVPQSTTSITEAGKPRLDIERDNLPDVVVWNPWKTKAANTPDYEPKDGYLRQICVEAGSVNGWITLEAGDVWEAGQMMKSL